METCTALLRGAPARLRDKRVAVGFDGFADRILRPIRKIEGGTLHYFDTIADFGAYLQARQGKSCSVELDVQTRKIGGNCPIFSAALGACGVAVDAVGMFAGGPFEAMPKACTLHSYAEVGTSDCLEFRDGKVMLAGRCTMAGDPFETVTAAVPELAGLLTRADLAAFLNWSELDYAPALWEQLCANIYGGLPTDKGKTVFFDLCDHSRKDAAAVDGVLRLIGRFSAARRTVLSLNENECLLLKTHADGAEGLPGIAAAVARKYGIDELVVHTLHDSYALVNGAWHARPTIFCEHPLLSTGAGDNFNAGYCLGLLLTDDADARLGLANLAASRYITTGANTDCAGLAAYAESLSN